MHKSVSLAAAAALLTTGSAAHANTTLEQLRSQAAQQLGQLEVNLTLLQSIEQQGDQLNDRNENLIARREEANRDQEQANAFCQGTFEEAEYNRRVAQCTTWQAGIDSRQNDIDNESAGLDRLYGDLQQRQQAAAQQGEQLLEGFAAAAEQWASGCASMPPAERPGACSPLASVGPLTSELLDWAQARFAELEVQCSDPAVAGNLERLVECQRQPWDGSVYDPGRPDTPGP